MRISTFASGSGGNCALVRSAGASILIDAGISKKRIFAALGGEGVSPGELSGVLITHEHSDHISGLGMLLKYCGVQVYAPRTVASRLVGMLPEADGRITVIHTNRPFSLGGAAVTAFHTSHDTPESVGYRIDGEASFGLCTDLGVVTDEVRETLCGVDAAMVEFNHDEELLRYGPYPVYLKRRILSEHGHLSNEAGAALAAYLAEKGAHDIILGHLSRENNTPERAYQAAVSALESQGYGAGVAVAPPGETLSVEVRARCSV